MNNLNRKKNQNHITETFVKKILAHLDEPDPNKLNSFLTLFSNAGSRIIFDSQPFPSPVEFIQFWNSSVVKTNHSLTCFDYQQIPGTNILIVNINGKIRFDETGRDKAGNDSVINDNNLMGNKNKLNNAMNFRPIWGSYFGWSLQLVLEDRLFNGDTNGIINTFDYNIVYKPSDSLIKV